MCILEGFPKFVWHLREFELYTTRKHACCKGNLRGKTFLANSQRSRKGIATKIIFLAKRSQICIKIVSSQNCNQFARLFRKLTQTRRKFAIEAIVASPLQICKEFAWELQYHICSLQFRCKKKDRLVNTFFVSCN